MCQESPVKHSDIDPCQVSNGEPTERKHAFVTAIESYIEYKDIQKKPSQVPSTLKRKSFSETTNVVAHQKSVFSIEQFRDIRKKDYKFG